MSYTPFLGKFPKIKYKPDNSIYGPTENVTDIFFRIGVVQQTINNASSFYLYLVNEGDTPEVLAEKIYGDPGAFWMILYANYLFDPQFDWPLNTDEFPKYISEKYRDKVNKATVGKVKIINPGVGYSDGYASVYDGRGQGVRVNISTNPETGAIQYANVEISGAGYYMNDRVTIDVTKLGGTGAELTAVMHPPEDEDVLFYVKTTDHHYEKIVNRLVKGSDQPEVSRFVVSKDQLTNGVIYLANTSGTFTEGEVAYIGLGEPGSNNSNAVFRGYVNSWEVTDTNPEMSTSNGWLTLTNTKGNYIPYNFIRGNTSSANGFVMFTSYDNPDDKKVFEYYNNLAETQSYEVNDYTDYTMIEIIKRYAISIWDHETELNEKRKLIKIIKPNYYQKILGELDELIGKYRNEKAMPIYSYKRRLF